MSDKQLPQCKLVPVDELDNTQEGGSHQVPLSNYGSHIPQAPIGYLGNAPQGGSFQGPHHYYGYHTPGAPVVYLGNAPRGDLFQARPHYYGYHTPGAPVVYLGNAPRGDLFQARPHYYGCHVPPAQMYNYPSNRYYPDPTQSITATYLAPKREIQLQFPQYPHPGGAWVGQNPVSQKTELTFQHTGRQADSPKTQYTPPFDQEEANDTNMESVPAKQDVTERVYNSVQDVNLSREIEVREIPDEATEDMLLNFFENKRKGGGPVADIKYSDSDHTAIVTFESPESVNTILRKQPCILLGKNIIISSRTISGDMDCMTPVAATSGGSNSEKKDGTSSICINGFKKTTTEETFTYYFENKRRSGGGKISSHQINREEGYICITFAHSSDAAEVLKRSHTIDGVTLTVRPHVLDEKMVLVTGLSGLLSEDTIQNFMEAKVNAGVQSITFGDDKTKAVVEFENPCDFNKIKETCEKHKLGGVHVTVCRVPKCNTVKVTGLSSKISKETLINYLENKRRSGGGTVERVESDPSIAVCLVYFQDHQVVGEVCKRSHVIEKTPVEIHPYHSCLGRSRAEKRKEFPPAPVMFTDFDPDKKKFLMKNLFCRDKLENELAKFYSKIIWKSEPSDNVLLECTLTSDIEGYLLLAESWQDTCLDCFKSFLKTLQSRVFQSNAQEWGLMSERLQRLNMSNKDKVAIFLEENNYTVTLVGDNSVMPAFIKQVEDVFAVKLVTKKFSLKKWQSQYLLAISFMNEIKDNDWNVAVEIHENEVELKGDERTVNEAAIQMHARLSDAITTKEKLLPEKLNLLQKEHIRSEVTEQLKASNIRNYPWEVSDGHLYLYTSTEEETSVMMNVMESMISQFFIELDKEIPNILHDPDWKELKERMYVQYGDRIFISDEKPGKVTVFSVSNIITSIKEKLERFFSEHALHNEVLKLDKGVVRFIQSHNKTEVDRFVQEASREKALQINFESLYTIAITGTKENLKAGKQMITDLEKQIQKQQYTFKRQGIVLYIGTPKGKECIKKAEKEAESVIELKGIQKQREEVVTGRSGRGWLQKRQHFHQLTKCATAKLSCGVKIKVLGGDITKLNVDVMVNAASSNLQHGAGVAAAFVRKGGSEIQEECTEYVKKNGNLSDAGVFVGSSGTLKCKALVHAVGPIWKDGESGEQKLLIKTISNCMQEVGKLKAESVVFPAVCAGNFGFSPAQACTSIVDTICNFFKEQKGNAGIKEVYLCDINKHCVSCFMQALEKKLGKDNIKVLVELQPEGRTVPCRTENTIDLDDVSDERTPVASTHFTFGNIQVKIVKAVLAKEYSDVIVNSVSKELKLEEGQLSKTLLKKGGGEIQNECNSSYPNGIQYGDIAITGSGKLPCKKIFHVALTAWDRNKDSAPALKTLVSHCLVEADKLKMNSISFPPIGTGRKRYPKHLVAKEMLQAVYDFCHQNQRTSIKDIRFVVFYKDEDILEAFEDASRSFLRRTEETGVESTKKQSWVKDKKVAEAGAAESESKRDKDKSEPVREDSSLDVVIYARSKQDINKAIRTVLSIMDREWTSMTIADPGIKFLNPTQKDDIYKTGKDNNANIKIDAKKGEIQVMGFFCDVMPISDKIHKILRQKVEQYHVQKEAQLLANVVKWFYIKNGKEVEFSANINSTIEKAFQAKCKSVKVRDRSGEEYEIDFNKMVEKLVKGSSTEFPVIRRDLIDKDYITAEKPKHWVNMKSNENLTIVPLNSSDPEYQKVVQDFHKSVGSTMHIVKVERIQNITLYTQYMATKWQLDTANKRNDNERVLWHGTPVAAIDSINAHGFNRSYCGACSIGNGVYFAVNASYSVQYGYTKPDGNGDKRIYQCRVLTGDYTQGSPGLRMPPAKSPTQPHILYDSVVDNPQSPAMFVIFHDAQAYPDYLITFK